MASERFRRLTVLLLAVALAAGLVAYGVRATEMGAHMAVATASEMPMSGQCDGCSGGGEGCTLGTCSVCCGNFTGLPVIIIVFYMLPLDAGGHAVTPIGPGWRPPPDPYPPKSAVLS